jgi:hypothetical protein
LKTPAGSAKLTLAKNAGVFMSKLDQLIAKALSTDSEEEAMTCLRFARKQAKTETVSKVSQPQTPIKELREIYNLREQLRILDIRYRDSATRAHYFMERMMQAQLDRNLIKQKLDKSELKTGTFKLLTAVFAFALISTILIML